VHQPHDLSGGVGQLALFSDAIVQVYGGRAVEDTDSDAVVGMGGAAGGFKVAKGARIVALGRIVGDGVVGDFRLPALVLFVASAAEEAGVLEL
jgi:hypothetical protein